MLVKGMALALCIGAFSSVVILHMIPGNHDPIHVDAKIAQSQKMICVPKVPDDWASGLLFSRDETKQRDM